MTIFTSEFAAELDKPLASERVVKMRGVDYLEGHDVIRRANELFGYGNWGYEVIGQPYAIEEGASKGGTPYQVWVCAVRLTVRDGFSILEYGTNTRSGTGSDGLEMAFKGCITDGVKRCLKAFGDQFGLVLYHKQHDHLLEQPPPLSHNLPPKMPPAAAEGPTLRDKLNVPLEWKTELNNAIAERKMTNATVAAMLKITPATVNEFYALAYEAMSPFGIAAVLDEIEVKQ